MLLGVVAQAIRTEGALTKDMRSLSRTQLLVIGFFALAWLSVVVLLVLRPDVYDEALRLGEASGAIQLAAVGMITALIAFLTVGVIRRWRWTFWLVMVAFLAGVLRVPVSVLQLTGVLHADVPTWYLAYQGTLGIAQFILGALMVLGYRRAGLWGAF